MCKDLVRRQEVEHFAGPVVEAFGDFVEIVLAMSAEVGAFGQILPDQPVGVFVAAALPGAVGIGEVDLDAGVMGERRMELR